MGRVKIYTFYTDSHAPLYARFVKSFESAGLGESFDLVSRKFPQAGSGRFMSQGWMVTMRRKIEYVLDSIDETFGSWFVHSDCDVQFFGDFRADIEARLDGFDLTAQRDHNVLCAGFFACRSNATMRDVFTHVLADMARAGNDQRALNGLRDRFLHRMLPDAYFTIGNINGGKPWNGRGFNLPREVYVHHANWVVGLQKKQQLMRFVAAKVGLVHKKRIFDEFGEWVLDYGAVPEGGEIVDFCAAEGSEFAAALALDRSVRILAAPQMNSPQDPAEEKPPTEQPIPDANRPSSLPNNSRTDGKAVSGLGLEPFAAKDERSDAAVLGIRQLRTSHPQIALVRLRLDPRRSGLLAECCGVRQICVEFLSSLGVSEAEEREIQKLMHYGYTIYHREESGKRYTFRFGK